MRKPHEDANPSPSLYIGVGASAGGLEALDAFFQAMPPDTSFGFVVIQHLSPDYKSLMVELLSKKTQMPVLRAEEGMTVEAGSVYLIPPKKNITIFHGKLLLSEQVYSQGPNLPIDVFLQSLAEDQGEKSVGIILSGTGSDGVRGIRAIKEAGGVVFAQSQGSAKFDGMPNSAISTGLVDFVLEPEEMPQQLVNFAEHPYVLKPSDAKQLFEHDDGLGSILAILRDKHKVDFTHYKMSTINRRIERRMSLQQVEHLDEYVRVLQQQPSEISALFKELLIGVTNFFRDPEAFEALEEFLLDLCTKTTKREMRLWAPGCSTGEEAYSLAILCMELLEKIDKPVDFKIFATDIDHDALVHAGNGMYPESISADLSAYYLSKYFVRRENGFQVSRSLREMVVFAHHNLIQDPPFTNIELIACRNLLIYLQPVLQNKVLNYFNFSLNPGGLLFLGSSETVGEYVDYFELVHSKWKIYRATGKPRMAPQHAEFSASNHDFQRGMRMPQPRFPVRGQADDDRVLERYVSVLSEYYVPVSIVVNEELEIKRVLGNTSKYLSIPSGKMENHLLQMAHEDLSIPLATGIQKALKQKAPIRYSNVRVSAGGETELVQLRFMPLPAQKHQEALLAIFIEPVQSKPQAVHEEIHYDLDHEAQERIQDLEQELQFTKENLQATIEELETSNEELQATNEELLSSNEELQSTNEELQSVNEELHTVNAEYQNKIFELTELTNDINNLLDSSQVGFLLLDDNLEIRKYSSIVRSLISITEFDVGKNIFSLNHQIENINLREVLQKALRQRTFQELEVTTADGNAFLMRILPYRISQEQFAGLVVTFVNIRRIKDVEEALQESHAFTQSVLNSMPFNVAVLDSQGTITYVNQAWRQFALENGAQKDYAGDNYFDICQRAQGSGTESVPDILDGIQSVFAGERSRFTYRYPCHSPSEERWFLMHAIALKDRSPKEVLVAHQDITSLQNELLRGRENESKSR